MGAKCKVFLQYGVFVLKMPSYAYPRAKGMGDGMKHLLFGVLLYVLLAVLLLPALVTFLCGGWTQEQPQEAKALYGIAELVPLESELEEYVAGVVAAEMPASFPEEALKAQAVAARTYQVRQMRAAGSDAVLYDVGQAYATEMEQQQKWGTQYAEYAAKIRKAVRDTQGEILLYEGEPILAAFHAQSGGKTEAAEYIWSQAVPYLQSVESEGDIFAPNHQTQVAFTAAEILEKLRARGAEGVSAENLQITIQSRTDAGYVDKVQVGKQVWTGRELREALGLRSADFTVEKTADGFLFTVLGYGHGAGMSQYGAAYLAEQGKSYLEILQHYYTGVTLGHLE